MTLKYLFIVMRRLGRRVTVLDPCHVYSQCLSQPASVISPTLRGCGKKVLSGIPNGVRGNCPDVPMVAIRRTHGPESRCRAERYVRRGANPTTGDEPVVSQRDGRSTGWSTSHTCPGVPSSASSSPLEESSRRAHQNEGR
eukprot:scaffold100494_cov66-Phaeocystis_antarctica.AAC.4